jgi:hypothetical protein
MGSAGKTIPFSGESGHESDAQERFAKSFVSLNSDLNNESDPFSKIWRQLHELLNCRCSLFRRGAVECRVRRERCCEAAAHQ